jgi:serine/threonine-protein kinase
VKLLDFGIAKLLEGEDGGNATLLTRDGEWALTPEYAAPEQLTNGAVTTATDVYSLGVLLFVLLCGRHPTASGRSPVDLLKAIVEEDAPRLSDAVQIRRADSSAAVETNAMRRGTTPDRLRSTLRGDLETIVGKALKKAPHERYASVTAVADDLGRYLAHLPISARPDTVAYRVAKFVRRNRVAVALTVVALLAVAGGVAGTFSQARRATRQAALAVEQTARAEAVRDFLFEVFNEAEPASPGRQPPTVLDVVKNAVRAARADRGMNALARTELLTELGGVLASQGDVAASQAVLDETFRDAEQRVGRNADATLLAGRRLAEALILAGEQQRARTLLDELMKRTAGQVTTVRAQLLTFSAYSHSMQREREASVAQAQEAVALCRRACAPDDLADALTALADAQNTFNEFEASAKTYEEVVALERQHHGASHIRVASTLIALSRPLVRLGQLERSEAMIREALAIDDAVLDRDDHRRGTHLNALMVLLRAKRDYPGALEASRESLRISRAAFGAEHPDVAMHLNSVGFILGAMGAYQDAIEPLGESLRLKERIYGPAHLQTALTRGNYGDALARAGDARRGEAELRRAIESYQRSTTKDPEFQATAMEKLARWHVDAGDGHAAMALYAAIPPVAEALGPRSTVWKARAAIGRGRALLILRRYAEARDALDEASRSAAQAALDWEPATELQLARAQVDQHLVPGGDWRTRAAQSLAAVAESRFPTVRLRAFADQVQREAATILTR